MKMIHWHNKFYTTDGASVQNTAIKTVTGNMWRYCLTVMEQEVGDSGPIKVLQIDYSILCKLKG